MSDYLRCQDIPLSDAGLWTANDDPRPLFYWSVINRAWLKVLSIRANDHSWGIDVDTPDRASIIVSHPYLADCLFSWGYPPC